MILRPGKTPDALEVVLVLRHAIGRIRTCWSAVEIIVRGDSHYGRAEALGGASATASATSLHLRSAGNPVLLRQVPPAARRRRPRAEIAL